MEIIRSLLDSARFYLGCNAEVYCVTTFVLHRHPQTHSPIPFPDHKTQDIFKGRCRRELQTIMHTCVCFVFCQASDLQNCISVLPATTTATTALPGHQKIPLNWQKLT
jgi:hypothetical protein